MTGLRPLPLGPGSGSGRQAFQPVDSGAHVLEGGRPAAAAAKAQPAVLEVPYRPAAGGQAGDQPVLQAQPVSRPPEATVYEDRHGPGAGARRWRELAELIPVRAVGIASRLDAGEYPSTPLSGA
jgi:hypothetical protein